MGIPISILVVSMSGTYDDTMVIVAVVIAVVVVMAMVAAYFYFFASGSSEIHAESSNRLVMQLSVLYSNDTMADLRVSMNNPESADFTDIYIKISDSYGYWNSAYFDSSGIAIIYIEDAKYTVEIQDLTGNGMLDNGEEMVINGGNNSVSGLTITLSIDGYSGSVETTIY